MSYLGVEGRELSDPNVMAGAAKYSNDRLVLPMSRAVRLFELSYAILLRSRCLTKVSRPTRLVFAVTVEQIVLVKPPNIPGLIIGCSYKCLVKTEHHDLDTNAPAASVD